MARVALAVAIGAGVAAGASCAAPPAPVYGGPPPGFDRGDAAAPASAEPSNSPITPTPTDTRGPAAMYGGPPPRDPH